MNAMGGGNSAEPEQTHASTRIGPTDCQSIGTVPMPCDLTATTVLAGEEKLSKVLLLVCGRLRFECWCDEAGGGQDRTGQSCFYEVKVT